MPYKTKLNLIPKGDKEELMEKYNAFKAKFSAMTEPDIDDFSDYVHVSMTSLQDSLQDELTSLMRSLKIIADDATNYLKFAFGMPNCKTFFCHPVEPFDLIATISSFKTVNYKTEEEANSAGSSLYWPGGGRVTAEYRTKNNENVLHMASSDSYISEAWLELSNQLRQHMSKWHNDVSEENHQSEKDTSHYYRWTIAIENKNTEFMNKLTYIKTLLPEIVISMQAWSSWMAENIIEQEILSKCDEGIDMTVFE